MRAIARCLLLSAVAVHGLSASAEEASQTRIRMTRQESALTGRERGRLRITLTETGSSLDLRLKGLEPLHAHAISVGFNASTDIVARFVPNAKGKARVRVDLVGPSHEIGPTYDPRGALVIVSSYEGSAVLSAMPFVEAEASPPHTTMSLTTAAVPATTGPETAQFHYARSRRGRQTVQFDIAGLAPGPQTLSIGAVTANVTATPSGTARIVLGTNVSREHHPAAHVFRAPLDTPLPNFFVVYHEGVRLFEAFLFAQIPGISFCTPATLTTALAPVGSEIGTVDATLVRLADCTALLELSLRDVTPANYSAQVGLDGYGGGIVLDDGTGVGSLTIPIAEHHDIRSGKSIVVSTLNEGLPTPAFAGVLP